MITKYSTYRKPTVIKDLPEEGMSEKMILAAIESKTSESKKIYRNDNGNLAGGIYYHDDHHWNFISDVVRMTIVSNPLHIAEF